MEYYAKAIDKGTLKFKGSTNKKKIVVWHDPCHLDRALGMYEEPRKVLENIPDVEFIELRKK
ncbi:MAG: heterodisulfide reductase-related iron-sulfur binding cluster [Thermoproteota archaeon]